MLNLFWFSLSLMTKSVTWYKVGKIFCKKINFWKLQNSKIKLDEVHNVVECLQGPNVWTFISKNFPNTIVNQNQPDDLVYLRHATYLSFFYPDDHTMIY